MNSKPLLTPKNLKRRSPQYSTSPDAPIQALRFIDEIDSYLWQASGNEEMVLENIPATLTKDLQIAWYRKLIASVSPRKLTIHDLREALLKDFDVDPKTQKQVLARYSGGHGEAKGGMIYLRSQPFKLVMNYIDEIEQLKEQLKARDKQAVEERETTETKWKSILSKMEICHSNNLNEKHAIIKGLRNQVEELKMTVKGLTVMLGEPDYSAKRNLEKAFEAFQHELSMSSSKLKTQLMKSIPRGMR
jgi:hypothetical protein